MTAAEPYRLGSAALPIYLPSLLFAIGEGAILPIIPVDAARLGGSLALAGFISALIAVGTLIGDLPSGWIVSRVGERNAMLGSVVVALGGIVLCFLAQTPAVLALGVLAIGVATASFALARQAFMTSFVPVSHRARALSLLGGMFRAGYFVGPFVAALVIGLTGSTRSVFVVHAVACVIAAGVLLALPDPADVLSKRRQAALRTSARAPLEDQTAGAVAEPPRRGLLAVILAHRGVLARMGTAAGMLQGLRTSRQVILPLVGVSLGMPESSIALVIGLAGAVDLALFFTSGQIMDRFGRAWSALPAMAGLGVAHLLLAGVVLLPRPVPWFIAVAILMSVANGIGSGIVMTFGADLAPKHDPAPFLGAYRFTSDSGAAVAPLVVAGLTAVVSLPFAAAAIGVVGLGGAGLFARWIPRYLPRPSRA